MIAWERPRCEAELGTKLQIEIGRAYTGLSVIHCEDLGLRATLGECAGQILSQ
jgi:hypothetical protein